MKKLFGTDGIRTVAGEFPLDKKTIFTLARALVELLERAGLETRVLIGRDTRESGPWIEEILFQGIQAGGGEAVSAGVIPTSAVSFLTRKHRFSAGIVISASHNPYKDNGIKIFSPEGLKISDKWEAKLEKAIAGGKDNPKISKLTISPEPELGKDYENFLKGQLEGLPRQKNLCLVVDCSNGASSAIAPEVFRELGFKVIAIHNTPDGKNINRLCGSLHPEDLTRKVTETGADLGVAYDGDADRLGAVDDTGQIIWGDQLMIIFARDLLASHPGAAVISEVKASQLLYDEIKRLGGRPIMWKTGHSLIKKKIREEKALLAGEMSGHIFFADRWFGFDDAIYASARLLEIVSRSDRKLSRYLSDLPRTYNTPEIRIYASDEVKFRIVEMVKEALSQRPEVRQIIDIDGVRAVFDRGWGLLRASNTQPVVVLRFEASSPEDLDRIRKEVNGLLEEVIKKLNAG